MGELVRLSRGKPTNTLDEFLARPPSSKTHITHLKPFALEMVGPVLYEATVPYFRKALENQVKLLKKGQEWCQETGRDAATLSSARLVDDMFPLPFHVTFCTFNVVQFLVDVGVTTAAPEAIVTDDRLSLDELMARVERTLTVLDGVEAGKLAAKEEDAVKINLGNFSVERPALQYAQQIAGPSFWFHHTMVYSILRVAGVPLEKRFFLSAF
ncbi:hypothetical protein ISF_09393 [Cordyceps fumosorosea ARSEF 2679]|uniref:Uncharacterized protein n=1 Tax=Cordyceps fumosorosea (strain ARSEF 2679) TaxID=1081104 RepID=A0A162M2Q2_CORFA|nr:hypothetical protein ISF_09393 [Cordyceps fumosorosea ARSEF 2679]OAA49690.1 hypothetical protein ISF_09393 [Cordyceps fumosorosea ARSEF 2679]